MSKPKTFENGRGELICTSCLSQVKHGYCSCNRHNHKATFQIELGCRIPKVGEEDVVNIKGEIDITSARVRITEIRSVNWWMRPGKTPGIEVWITFSIIEVIAEENPRPILTLVK